MLDYGLEGAAVLVTGGGSGIGEATALMLAGMGARVAVIDRDGDAAERVASAARDRGADAIALSCDVADAASVDGCIDAVVGRFGRLDAAVNNAGTGLPPTKTAEIADDDWRRVMGVNLDGVFFCMRAELRHMVPQRGGAIVNVASILGAVGSDAGSSAYTASKHAVVGLTKTAALEYAHEGIRVNAVGPGYILTPLMESVLTADVRRRREQETPLGRLGHPEEAAAAIVWLCSPGAGFVTGSYHPVDGGYLAR